MVRFEVILKKAEKFDCYFSAFIKALQELTTVNANLLRRVRDNKTENPFSLKTTLKKLHDKQHLKVS